MSETIEKASESEIRITTTEVREVVRTLEEVQQERDAALGIIARIDERRAVALQDLEAERAAAEATVAKCAAQLVEADKLGVIAAVSQPATQENPV